MNTYTINNCQIIGIKGSDIIITICIVNIILIAIFLIVFIVSDYKREKLLRELKEQKEVTKRIESNLNDELKLTQVMMNDFLKSYSKLVEKNNKN